MSWHKDGQMIYKEHLRRVMKKDMLKGIAGNAQQLAVRWLPQT
jgi:hypothetical protein